MSRQDYQLLEDQTDQKGLPTVLQTISLSYIDLYQPIEPELYPRQHLPVQKYYHSYEIKSDFRLFPNTSNDNDDNFGTNSCIHYFLLEKNEKDYYRWEPRNTYLYYYDQNCLSCCITLLSCPASCVCSGIVWCCPVQDCGLEKEAFVNNMCTLSASSDSAIQIDYPCNNDIARCASVTTFSPCLLTYCLATAIIGCPIDTYYRLKTGYEFIMTSRENRRIRQKDYREAEVFINTNSSFLRERAKELKKSSDKNKNPLVRQSMI